jgi:hypothetical protein
VKKLTKVLLLVGLMSIMLCACGKKVECDICGEKKVCTEKSVFGEKINICDDCMDVLESGLGLD